ncbi:hypothetical protein [Rhizobium sp. Rhizsp82]|uniref:hypothetical protein n=1 Tax=Rhizobium sp. Rhizsp82 TaxID=3243057 RepID=UPI0039B4E814
MTSLATELHAIADRIARLEPSHRDPHRYFEEKSELVDQLRRLASSSTLPGRLRAANDNRPNRSAV